ncbi:MAG: phosphate acyltransferase PlsX [Acidimicrobiales bacterium]|nr:phosphate acyltransferase PlsX [Acidimicrobiales bacterium]
MSATDPLPVAVDAMGGDHAPAAVVEGAAAAAAEGIPVLLVGRPDELGDTGDLPVLPASEVISMSADPAKSVRTMKDSSLVRAAEACRDGIASAMVSAGNTGATMGSALLRMGRIKGAQRPAIATPLPRPGQHQPTLMLDSGANAECLPEWLVQFAAMGAIYGRLRWGVDEPRVGLLSIGEEAGKGNPLVKAAYELLSDEAWQRAAGARFVGNVEGRDLLGDAADVVVTDGFTGNVALKTAEGTAKTIVKALLEAFDSSDDARAGAQLLMPALLPLYATLDPESVGGAVLLGVRGVCIISHGSSSPAAITNAIRVAADAVRSDLVGQLGAALA